MIQINKLKKGDFFKRNDSTAIVWVYDGYNRFTKKYSAHKFDDFCHYMEFKKGKEVFIDFEF